MLGRAGEGCGIMCRAPRLSQTRSAAVSGLSHLQFAEDVWLPFQSGNRESPHDRRSQVVKSVAADWFHTAHVQDLLIKSPRYRSK